MKILIVCQFYYPENFVITNIAERLASFGHQVSVLTGKPNYGYGHILKEYKHIKHEVINNVNVERVHLFARRKSKFSIICNYLSFYFSSRKWVRRTKEKFDIVYSFSLSPVTILSAGNLYKKKHNVPHVVHCVDLWPESVVSTGAVKKNSLMYKILYKWSKALYKGADEILIGSPSFKEYFNNVLKIEGLKLTYIPQCSLITECNEKPYEYDKDYFNILYCGNLGYLQNTHLIPESMSYVNSKVKFHVIGMGPCSNRLVGEINKNNLKDKVIYYGPMNAKKASSYFVNADAFFISLSDTPYVGQSIPNKIMMYMCFGKPILGVINGDGRKVLEEAKGSLIIEENAAKIAQNIDKIASFNQEERRIMGLNNSKYYNDHFHENVISKEIDKILLDHKAK